MQNNEQSSAPFLLFIHFSSSLICVAIGMSGKDSIWIVAVTVGPTVLFLCAVFISIRVKYALKKAKEEHPAIGDVDTPPSSRRRVASFPKFARPLQVNMLSSLLQHPDDDHSALLSNEELHNRIAMETPPQTTPPS